MIGEQSIYSHIYTILPHAARVQIFFSRCMCWFVLSTAKTTDEYPWVPSSVGGWIQRGKVLCVRLANSKAGIKPTTPLSAFDKENSIEFPLDFLHYLYNYYMVCALFSHAYHVTHHVTSCDVTL